LDDDEFAAKYLSSGIDLRLSESNNISQQTKQQQQQLPATPDCPINLVPDAQNEIASAPSSSSKVTSNLSGPGEIPNENFTTLPCLAKEDADEVPSPIKKDTSGTIAQTVSADLTKLAIQHLDKHQWQLPLMEMDQKFRDKTYYKHYSDSYISSLRSKLGNFLADNQLLSNPMRYHAQAEQDNYEKYSKMFNLLTDYYQSLGSNFFSFTTPSPDEEIVIGCRLGTKGYYHPSRSMPSWNAVCLS
jgi:hypothetical protein